MIAAIWSYLREEIWKRRRAIICGSESWVSVLLGVAVGVWGDGAALAAAEVGDIVTVVLTYASIALGFCLAGLTLAVTLPDQEFARTLARTVPKGASSDAYQELLFVFSWTAIAHWVMVSTCIVAIAVVPSKEAVFPASFDTTRRLWVGASVAVVAYGLCQFLITLVTLSQVGRRYIESLRAR